MSDLSINSITTLLWGKSTKSGSVGCGGNDYNPNKIVLNPDEFGIAWSRTSIDMCNKKDENPILNNVKSPETSLWEEVAVLILKRATFRKRYEEMTLTQQKFAVKKLAEKLTDNFTGKKLKDIVSPWDWYMRLEACQTNKPFPATVDTYLTPVEVDNILREAQASPAGDGSSPTKIVQVLGQIAKPETVKVREGQTFTLPAISFTYGEEVAREVPSSCEYIIVNNQEIPANVTENEATNQVTAKIDPEQAADVIFKPVKGYLLEITAQRPTSIDTAGTYSVDLACDKPALAMAGVASIEVKPAPGRRPRPTNVSHTVVIKEEKHDSAAEAREKACKDSDGRWKASSQVCKCPSLKKLDGDECVADQAAIDRANNRAAALARAKKAKKNCEAAGRLWKNNSCVDKPKVTTLPPCPPGPAASALKRAGKCK